VRRSTPRIGHALTAASLAALLVLAPTALAVAAPGAASPWTRTGAQNVGRGHNELLAAAYAGASAWAVGDYYDGAADRTLVEQWAGTSWRISPSPNVGTLHNELEGVGGSSPRDVWAVGRYEPPVGQERALAMHWNGLTWRVVPTPNQGLYHNELAAVADVGPANVWAVGHYDLHRSITDEALVEHWNGLRWTVVGCPHPVLSHSGFTAVAAVPGTRSLWAVGYRIQGGVTRTLVERWAGGRWTIVTSPSVGLSHNELDGVAASSASSAWAVGYAFVGTADRPLIEHWNGRRWSVVTVGGSSALHEVLQAVVATSGRSAIAVGDQFFGTADRTLIVRWNGATWSRQPSPNAGINHNVLAGVAASRIGSPVAVGTFYSGAADQALTLRCSC
jgi:hypothetical protein